MNAKEYFWANVLMVVELEDEDGFRFWSDPMNVKTCDEYTAERCKNVKDMSKPYYLSDKDFLVDEQQPNSFVRRVMKLATLNFFKNSEWCKKHELGSFYDVIDFICDNDLWKVE